MNSARYSCPMIDDYRSHAAMSNVDVISEVTGRRWPSPIWRKTPSASLGHQGQRHDRRLRKRRRRLRAGLCAPWACGAAGGASDRGRHVSALAPSRARRFRACAYARMVRPPLICGRLRYRQFAEDSSRSRSAIGSSAMHRRPRTRSFARSCKTSRASWALRIGRRLP